MTIPPGSAPDRPAPRRGRFGFLLDVGGQHARDADERAARVLDLARAVAADPGAATHEALAELADACRAYDAAAMPPHRRTGPPRLSPDALAEDPALRLLQGVERAGRGYQALRHAHSMRAILRADDGQPPRLHGLNLAAFPAVPDDLAAPVLIHKGLYPAAALLREALTTPATASVPAATAPTSPAPEPEMTQPTPPAAPPAAAQQPTDTTTAQPQPQCHYPGCTRPPIANTGAGRPNRYCDDPAHNKVTAYRRRQELKAEAAHATGDTVSDDLGQPVEFSSMRTRDLLPAVQQLGNDFLARLAELVDQAGTLGDPEAAAVEIDTARNHAARQIERAHAELTTARAELGDATTAKEEAEADKEEAEAAAEEATAQALAATLVALSAIHREATARADAEQAITSAQTQAQEAVHTAQQAAADQVAAIRAQAEETIQQAREEHAQELARIRTEAAETVTAAQTDAAAQIASIQAAADAKVTIAEQAAADAADAAQQATKQAAAEIEAARDETKQAKADLKAAQDALTKAGTDRKTAEIAAGLAHAEAQAAMDALTKARTAWTAREQELNETHGKARMEWSEDHENARERWKKDLAEVTKQVDELRQQLAAVRTPDPAQQPPQTGRRSGK